MAIEIHPTAIVETDKIGDGTVIGCFAYIGKNVEIGKNCWISGFVSIGMKGQNPMERDCRVGHVRIGNDVVIREHTSIHAGITTLTEIDNGCYIMANVHIGHDVKLGKYVTVGSGSSIAGYVMIGDYSFLGINTSIHQRSMLGRWCMLGAGSFFKGISPDAIVWAGVPARPLKVNTLALDRFPPPNREMIIQMARRYMNDKALQRTTT